MGPVYFAEAVTPSNQRELALKSCEASVPSRDGGQIRCGIIMDSYTRTGLPLPDCTRAESEPRAFQTTLTGLKYTQVYTALSQSV